MAYEEWFRDAIAFYRDLEFFSSGPFHGLTVDECCRVVEAEHPNWYRDRYREAVDLGRGHLLQLERWVLTRDKARVWWQDAEWVYSDTSFYREGVERLGEISRNVFHPENSSEIWIPVDDAYVSRMVIRVEFRVGDRATHLWINRVGDHADREFVSAINQTIRSTGQQFREFERDQDWLVICQTEEEAAAMVHRGHICDRCDTVSRVLQYPDGELSRDPERGERWLYVHRGLFKYESGDIDGAWADFRVATRLGVDDIHLRVAAVEEERARMTS